jgi:hypothetical protein
MAQVFRPRANTIARGSLAVAGLLVIGALGLFFALCRSSYVTRQGIAREQPVPFSHQHHVSGLGIDCRYCHTGVEEDAFAGIPPTQTCMNCHAQIWNDAPMLAPVRNSFRTGDPIKWNRVHDLPDFAFFNHSIHVAKGVGCSTCHGQVDRMPLMWKEKSLFMEWCLDCHRAPEKYLRPKEEVFNMAYQAPADQLSLGLELKKRYNVNTEVLTSCSTCHR